MIKVIATNAARATTIIHHAKVVDMIGIHALCFLKNSALERLVWPFENLHCQFLILAKNFT